MPTFASRAFGPPVELKRSPTCRQSLSLENSRKGLIRGRRGLGSAQNFRVGLGWARPSPTQARKIRVGLLAYGPKILICNKKTSKIGFFYVSEENIFHLIDIFQNMPKFMMKLRQGNLPPYIFFFFYIWASPWAGLGWAGFFNSGPAQPKTENPGPCRPLGLIESS